MMEHPKSPKQALRVRQIMARKSLDPEVKRQMDARIRERVLRLGSYKNAHTVLCYVSTALEIDTRLLMRQMLDDGKRVAVPCCVPDTPEIIFYFINSMDDLRPGTYSILEPDPLSCSPCDPALDALCLVPGLSFDDQGYRLGYGKGYYDRFLASFTGLAIGLCYFRDLTRKLPRGRFDFPVHTMVTERAVMAARAIT